MKTNQIVRARWMRGGIARLLLVLCTTFLPGEAANRGGLGPTPPCDGTSVPPYPDLDKSPAVQAWGSSELGQDWIPPACTGWTKPGFTSLVTTVARFRYSSGIEGLLRRVGAISELAGVRYWSVTHKRWQTMIVDASALSDPGGRRRRDFAANEIATGRDLYFVQEDNLSGKATYRMHIYSATADRLVFDIENTTSVRYLMWPLFRPGELQAVYFLERESDDVWRYYGMSRTGRKASSLTSGHDASSVNRAVAYFRHLAGIPTDQNPPAAP